VGRPPGGRALSGPSPVPPADPSGTIPEGLDATLVLLRHGETDAIVAGRFQGSGEFELTDVGRRQAALAGSRLARPHEPPALGVPRSIPREIVHSPLRRTRETAELVAAAIARPEPEGAGATVPLLAEPGFREIGQGRWEGMLHTEITERYGAELGAWRRTPTLAWAPEGEPLADVQARVRPALASLMERLAHGGTPGDLDRPQVPGYRGSGVLDGPWAILVGHDGVFKVTMLTLFAIPLERFWSLLFPLCGLTVVEIRGGRPVLRAHGLVDHLAPLHLDLAAEVAAEARRRAGAL
jgi:broad specificity phosphatase PhoE